MKFNIGLIALLFGLVSQSALGEVKHGVSLELNNGVGYTLSVDRLWAGINLYAYQMRFDNNGEQHQLVIAPKAFVYYDFMNIGVLPVFSGFSYKEDFGLSNDKKISKHRLAAIPLGTHFKFGPGVELAGWANLAAVYENLNYDSTTNTRYFDTTTNRRVYFEFGGVSATYYF